MVGQMHCSNLLLKTWLFYKPVFLHFWFFMFKLIPRHTHCQIHLLYSYLKLIGLWLRLQPQFIILTKLLWAANFCYINKTIIAGIDQTLKIPRWHKCIVILEITKTISDSLDWSYQQWLIHISNFQIRWTALVS